MNLMRFPALPANRRTLIWMITTFAISMAPSGRAMAKSSSNYDLDSLVYLADHIVEGEITRFDPKHNDPSADVTLTAIHAGTLSVGQTIAVSGIRKFGKFAPLPAVMEPFAVGDRLFLFLKEWPAPVSNDRFFSPVGSGLKWVVGDSVRGFPVLAHLRPNTTTFLSENPAKMHLVPLPTPGEFRAEIKEALPRAAAWHAEFKLPAEQNDIPRLLSLLSSRRKMSQGDQTDDEMELIASERLANLHDVRSLHKALQAGIGNARALQVGFGTSEGRDYLLVQIAGKDQSRRSRMELADAIAHAGGVYRSTLEFPEPEGRSAHIFGTHGNADQNNSWYLTRIAKLAVSGSLDEDGSEELLQSVEDLAGSTMPDKEIRADLDSVVNLLRPLINQESTSNRMRRQIERVLRAVADGPPRGYRLPYDE